jgi:ATP-dependent Clp protease ATP-binding subunit ClpB
VLLDEIEKAHPDVFNVLLQVSGRRATDRRPRPHGELQEHRDHHDLQHRQPAHPRDARGDERSYQRMREQVLDALRRHFRPEFLNRVDEVVVFRALTEAELEKIVEIQLEGLRSRLAERRITLEVARSAALPGPRRLRPVFGARPLKRVIQREVETPIARLIVAGKLRDGGRVHVEVAADALRVEAV